MDAAEWEDLAGRLYGLLVRLEDRLGGEQAEWFLELIAVGEYGLALEEIAGALAQDKIAITDDERGDMLALAERMTMDDLVAHAVGFCPQAAHPAQPWRHQRQGPGRNGVNRTAGLMAQVHDALTQIGWDNNKRTRHQESGRSRLAPAMAPGPVR
jgi:hypothetical protein